MKKNLLLLFALLLGAISSSAAETTIWEDTPLAIDWSTNVIVVDKNKFASANAGDVLHLTVDAVSGGYPQVIVCVPGAGTDLEGGVHLDAAGIANITVTGDILKVAKIKGLQFKGDGMTISKITIESDVYTGRPNSAIWIGEAGTTTIARVHFNFASLAAGDIIKANFSTKGTWCQLLPSQKSSTDYSWGDAYSLTKKEEVDNVQFTVTESVATNSFGIVLQSGGYTFTSVEIIKADMTGSSTIWTGEQVYKTWAGFSIAASNFVSAKPGYLLRFSISELYDNDVVDSWKGNGIARIMVKNGEWADFSPKFESEDIPVTTAVPMTYDMTLTQAVIDIAQISGLVIQGMGFTLTKVELVPTVPATIDPSYEWATFSSDYALDFTGVSDLKAYMVLGHEGTTITKTQVTGTVPAGTGLLLNGVTANIPVVASSSTDVSANKLKRGTGAGVATESGKTKYVLSHDGTAVKFLKVSEYDSPTVDKGKAYLEFNEVISARSLDFDGDVTAIKNIKVGSEDNVYYDLQGRRVLYPTKGLYIVNGKKVILK